MIACSPEGIVTRSADQGSKKGVTHRARGASEPSDGMIGDRAKAAVAMADSQRHEHQEPFVVLGQVAHQVGQECEGVGVLGQGHGGGGCLLVAAEHGGVDEEVGKEGVVCRTGHGAAGSILPRGWWTQDNWAYPAFIPSGYLYTNRVRFS